MADSTVPPRPRISAPLRGVLWMVASCACFALMATMVRRASFDVHPVEIVFFRYLFGLLFLAPWLLRAGLAPLRTRRLGMHLFRALAGMGVVLTWFTAVSLMPLAEATALAFTAPLFATLGAALFLGESVRLRRWSAIAIGFAGAMIILRPGLQAISWPALLALASSAFLGTAALVIKSLSRTEESNTIVLYLCLLTTPLTAIGAFFVWTTPSLESLAWMAGIGVVATIGQLAYTRAFAATETSIVMPLTFFKLIFAALLGYFFFAEVADSWTWIGAAVIFGSAVYTARREAQLATNTP
ncbi:MAG: DMT family transporter [Rhodospirillales bacterium]|nr:DMT family transporter [Rhodospirillales bacterium]